VISELNKAWKAHRASAAIDPVMRFTDRGLVLGAGTVLAKSGADSRGVSVDVDASRLRALLAAAHLRALTSEALAHLRKAAERWSEGQESLAAMHLALSGVSRLERPEEAANRLFLADGLLRAGFEPGAIVASIEAGDTTFHHLRKTYNPDQPRVPAGSGATSGEWTSGDGGSSSSGSPDTAGSADAESAPDSGSGRIRPQEAIYSGPGVNQSTVTQAMLPPQGSIYACEEAESDCHAAANYAARNDAANDNSRFIDNENCKAAGFWCDTLSWMIEDIPFFDRGGVRFPHGGVVLIDKGKLDRYLPPLFGRPPPIRRSL
jgi:hypothetical protein